MKVAVIGAGVAGITTAWELTMDGHTVTVLDKGSGIAEGASFASPGWIGVAGLTAWDPVSPVWPTVGPAGLTASPQWLTRPGARRWLSALKKHRLAARASALFATHWDLAALSVDRLRSTLSHSGTELERTQGMMLLVSTEADAAAHAAGVQLLQDTGMKVTELDAAAARKLEPGLTDTAAPATRWWLPDDEVINGRQWLNALKTEAQRHGCVFQLATPVTALHPGGGVTCVDRQLRPRNTVFDAVVVCAGYQGNELLANTGLNVPLLNMNQCALSAPIREPHLAPVSGVLDAQYRISITRTGSRIRVGSATGLWPGQDAEPVYKLLYERLNEWFPGSASLHGAQSCAQTWQTTCAFTPDGLPLVGASGIENIWLNLGYGAKGWTLAPGAARLLANHLKGAHQVPLLDSLAPVRFN